MYVVVGVIKLKFLKERKSLSWENKERKRENHDYGHDTLFMSPIL